MINTDAYSDRCVVCGKFLKSGDRYGKLCPKHYEILNLIDKTNNAIFNAESALFKLEKAHACKPLYRMRINLGYVKQGYRNGIKVCDMVTPLEMVGRL